MAKDINDTISSIIDDEVAANISGLSGLSFSFYKEKFDPEAVISQMLDNNLATLESLRVVAENTFQKDRSEVRLFGHPASALLSGIEKSVSYHDLVEVINAMKAGIARRRAAA